MPRVTGSESQDGSITAGRLRLNRAEQDYYDCLSHFGHESGEAHAAQIIWHNLRSKAHQAADPN